MKLQKPRILTESELNMIRGKAILGRARPCQPRPQPKEGNGPAAPKLIYQEVY